MTPTPLERYLQEVEERCRKATPGPYRLERVGFSNGDFAYEVNDDHQLVQFHEFNFEPIMKAKFNAELYASSITDIPRLLAIVRRLVESHTDPYAALKDCDRIAEGEGGE